MRSTQIPIAGVKSILGEPVHTEEAHPAKRYESGLSFCTIQLSPVFSACFWPPVFLAYRGAELANAIELKALVSGEKQLVPPGLLEAYPNLASIALKTTENPV